MQQSQHGSCAARNFRDVGASVNVLANADLVREGLLLRGGSIRHLDSLCPRGQPEDDPKPAGGRGSALGRSDRSTPSVSRPGRSTRTMQDRTLFVHGCAPFFAASLKPATPSMCTAGAEWIGRGWPFPRFSALLGLKRALIVEEYCLSAGVQDGARITCLPRVIGGCRTLLQRHEPRTPPERPSHLGVVEPAARSLDAILNCGVSRLTLPLVAQGTARKSRRSPRSESVDLADA